MTFAQVWGRHEISPFAFTQEDVDMIIEQLDHRGHYGECWTMETDWGQAVLSLAVSVSDQSVCDDLSR